jgi:hypothetical protein
MPLPLVRAGQPARLWSFPPLKGWRKALNDTCVRSHFTRRSDREHAFRPALLPARRGIATSAQLIRAEARSVATFESLSIRRILRQWNRLENGLPGYHEMRSLLCQGPPLPLPG